MSTRCYIAKQIGEDLYRAICCHFNGYIEHCGAVLLDTYDTPEKVNELLSLGDIKCLGPKLYPAPDQPHGVDCRQEDVTTAYARDLGEEKIEAEVMTLGQLDHPAGEIEYVYIFTRSEQWKFFECGCLEAGLRDVRETLDEVYSQFGLTRPEGYFGMLTNRAIEQLRKEQGLAGTAFQSQEAECQSATQTMQTL